MFRGISSIPSQGVAISFIQPLNGRDSADASGLADTSIAHVLAAALASGAAFLLSLDRRHLLTPAVEAAGLPVTVMTPGDFLREVFSSGPVTAPLTTARY